MYKKSDIRKIRTKSFIKKAFLKLLEEKNYCKITVADITQEALINRNTFYLHYLDKKDLLQKISSECLIKINDCMETSKEIFKIKGFGYDHLYNIINTIFKIIDKDSDFYKVILTNKSIPYYSSEFRNLVKKSIHTGLNFHNKITAENSEIYSEYMTAGFISVVKYWLNTDKKYSVDEISRLVIDLYSNDILKLTKKI